ncbi:hypothetical protein [Phenylobacterium sp.]|uniref:hypothetical protein n=1 Tax=Phenylobacterium sp. TaxID=1871053 RepID=UPI002731FD27|nr:hypothetical protein [Phenylobacterium sp.]MDP1599580.1 hypothetical protein [Phenylobacterium sp.]MDP3593462.1 hypothetical protein [Phenylobacterium sp.]
MLKVVALIALAGTALPEASIAAPAWRVQQACAMQRYLRATPAFPSNWGHQSANVSLNGSRQVLVRREDPDARAQFDAAMRSGRGFADRAAEQLAMSERITQQEAYRRIGSDPGPWPQVTPAKCQALEKRALKNRP